MLKLCAFFVFVLAVVVCGEESEAKAKGLGDENGNKLVKYFGEEVAEKWKYNVGLEEKVEQYLDCAWEYNPMIDGPDSKADSNSPVATNDNCKEKLGLLDETILHGSFDGDNANSWDDMLRDLKSSWVDGGKKEGDSENLQEKLSDAKKKEKQKVSCASYYDKSSWEDYANEPRMGGASEGVNVPGEPQSEVVEEGGELNPNDNKIGDLACIFYR